jgi:hypothetical protein
MKKSFPKKREIIFPQVGKKWEKSGKRAGKTTL